MLRVYTVYLCTLVYLLDINTLYLHPASLRESLGKFYSTCYTDIWPQILTPLCWRTSYLLSAITQISIDITMSSEIPGPVVLLLIFLACVFVIIGSWQVFRYFTKKSIQRRTPHQVYQIGHDDRSIASHSSFQSPPNISSVMPPIAPPPLAMPPPVLAPQH